VEAAEGVLQGRLPRTLPEGFGFLLAWRPGPSDPTSGAAWADARCRTVVLRLSDVMELGGDGPPVGDWTLIASRTCGNGLLQGVLCLEYRVVTAHGLLSLSSVALARQEADAVALSVTL
jgi:hypothetical protein